MSDSKRVAIIGGGISGLAAAHRLHELAPTSELALFESSERLGGVIRTEHLEGFRIELGPDSILAQVPAAIDLCSRVGIAADLIGTNPQQRGIYVVCRGRLRRMPDGLALMAPQRLWPVMISPILSIPGKLRLACEYFIPRRPEATDESLAQFATRRVGREAFDRLVQPLVSGIYMGSPDRLSVRATFPRFVEMEAKHGGLMRGLRAQRAQAQNQDARAGRFSGGPRYGMFVAPREGMEQLVAAIVARLPPCFLRLRRCVEELTRLADGRWQIVTSSQSSGKETEVFDAVIVATSASAASRLLCDAAPGLAVELDCIEHTSCIVVNLAFHKGQIRHALDAYGFVTPLVESRSVLACTFSSVKYAGRAPKDKVLLRAFLGGAGDPQAIHWPDDKIKEAVLSELGDLLGARGEPLFFKVQRWRRTMPQYELGHLERIERIEHLLDSVPGLALAGNAYRGVGVAHCIQSGENAAAQVHPQIQRVRPFWRARESTLAGRA
jgi:oxygen-dependent protoporphyrinogen oxidase